MAKGNGKLPEIVRLEAEVEQLNARLALAHREIRSLWSDLAGLEHVCITQPIAARGELGLGAKMCRDALLQSHARYPDAEDD